MASKPEERTILFELQKLPFTSVRLGPEPAAPRLHPLFVVQKVGHLKEELFPKQEHLQVRPWTVEGPELAELVSCKQLRSRRAAQLLHLRPEVERFP